MPELAGILLSGTFIFWTSMTLMCVVPALAHYWYRAQRAKYDAGLKHDMLERGMSAEEIERVLRASSGKRDEETAEKTP